MSVIEIDPVALSGVALSGIEQLRAFQDGRAEPPAFAALLGLRIERVEEGVVEFALEPGVDHLNPMGTLHGGVIATMLDTAMGAALQTTLPVGASFTTLQLNVHYLKAAFAGGPSVHAVGNVVHRGKRTASAEARLVRAGDGAVLAHASSHLLVLP